MDENEQLAQEHDKPSSEPMQDQPDAQQAEEPAGGAASSEPDAAGAPMQQKRSRSRERKATASAPEAMTTGAAAPAAEPDIELPEEQPDAPALKVSPTAAEPVPVPDGGTSGDETLGAGGVQPPQEDEILEAADELRARVAKLIAAEARARGLPTPALATAILEPSTEPQTAEEAELLQAALEVVDQMDELIVGHAADRNVPNDVLERAVEEQIREMAMEPQVPPRREWSAEQMLAEPPAPSAEAPAAKPTAPRPAESQDRTWRKPIDKRVEAVDEDECGGDLEVVVVARRPAMDLVRGKRARKGGDEEVDYIAGATVTISPLAEPFRQTTGAGGAVFWEGLNVDQQYTVHVDPPLGYVVPPDQPITIEEGENVLEFTLEPMLVEFAVMAKLVDGEKEYPIEKLAIEGYRGQERLGCEDTNPQGLAVLCNIFPGELTLALKPTVRLTDGRMLRLAHSSRVAVYADGYQTEPAKVYYTYGPAAIEVRAVLLLNVDGKQKEIDLPGIPVAVYRGQSAIGAPLNTGTTDVRALIFPDLDQVDYTVAIASRNVTFRGQPLKLADGLSETWLAQVRAGHTQSIKFVFQPCAATVVGAVVDANCGAPLADVPFILASIDDPSVVISATSDSSGRLPFPNVPLGRYRALPARERLTLADGRTWELEKGGLSQSVERVIEVPASGTVQIDAPFKLVPERHRIYGMVTIGNQLVPHAIIDIYDDQGKLVRTVESDTLGKYEAEVERAGNYHVTVRMVLGAPVQPAQRFPVKVASDAELNLPLPGSERNASLFGGVSPVPPPPANGQLRDAAVDLSAYPVLTTEVSATASPQPVGGAGGAPLGQVVEGALREVLAWRPRASDPKGFVAALNQSFTCSEAEGRSVCTWTPRSYAVQVDLGAVTGAQASIYMRAKAALDQSLPLLEGLYPLRPDADEQDIEANRAIINSNEVELVNELGVQGGPRAARVDALFDSLLGGNDATPSTIDELVPDSQFGQMRDLFGFTPAFVNTVDEEQNLTNFIILVDHASALRRSWVAQRDFFTGRGGAEPFFGTQMILLSRSLAVVVEAVEETSFVMDSVFLDSAERQTLELTYANEHPIFLGELLRWAYDFASTEAPRLIQEGGKSGVIAVTPTLERLERLVRGAMLRPDGEQDPAAFPAGYRTARVQRSLQELSSHLAEALELASEIRRNGLANARFGRRFVRR